MSDALREIHNGSPDLVTTLRSAGLVVDDLHDGGRFFALDIDGGPVAYGGLDGDGADRLLRSVVTVAGRRSEGFGGTIVAALIDQATRDGASSLWLLTTSAQTFFERFGFATVDRRAAPAEILARRQAAALCPATATLMHKVLAP